MRVAIGFEQGQKFESYVGVVPILHRLRSFPEIYPPKSPAKLGDFKRFLAPLLKRGRFRSKSNYAVLGVVLAIGNNTEDNYTKNGSQLNFKMAISAIWLAFGIGLSANS